MKQRVCVVTGTRAEFGLLEPLIKKLNNDDEIDLQLAVTGSHLSDEFGNTQEEIEKAGFGIATRIKVDLSGDTKADMAVATGRILSAFAEYFAIDKPDLVVVLGDRYEIFAATSAAALQGVPVAHIHGGETTEGAVDEFLRHSISKMSSLHFAACEEYRKRIIQLGESPDRVFNVGSLGVENTLNLQEMPLSELSDDVGVNLNKGYVLVTLHPATQENDTAETQVNELIAAMNHFPELSFIITKANADAGGRTINNAWEKEAIKHNNWVVVSSLGSKRYLSALKNSKMIIGNSSSGIIEAPAVHVPTVNVGDRQKGRIMADSVICCDICEQAVVNAMLTALSDEFINKVENVVSPFGSGRTSDKIFEVIKDTFKNGQIDTKKKFYDL